MDLNIIEELSIFLDKPTPASLKELKVSIERDGVRDPIVVWKEKGAIVDGHNRYAIAKELKKEFPTVEMSFADLTAVKEWMIRNQVGRRNLSPERLTYYIGQLYMAEKKTMPASAAAAKIAAETGVSEKTVQRAEKVATATDILAKLRGKVAAEKHLAGQGDLTNSQMEIVGSAKSELEAEIIIDGLTKIQQNAKHEKAVVKALSPAKAPLKAPVKAPAKASATKAPAATASNVIIPAAKPAATAAVKKTVAFANPNYDAIGFVPNDYKLPDMDRDAIVYIVAPDQYLDQAMFILKKGGYSYDCSFVFHGIAHEEGVWSKISHIQMIVGTRGVVSGPPIEKASLSLIRSGPDYLSSMKKIIADYHPQMTVIE